MTSRKGITAVFAFAAVAACLAAASWWGGILRGRPAQSPAPAQAAELGTVASAAAEICDSVAREAASRAEGSRARASEIAGALSRSASDAVERALAEAPPDEPPAMEPGPEEIETSRACDSAGPEARLAGVDERLAAAIQGFGGPNASVSVLDSSGSEMAASGSLPPLSARVSAEVPVTAAWPEGLRVKAEFAAPTATALAAEAMPEALGRLKLPPRVALHVLDETHVCRYSAPDGRPVPDSSRYAAEAGASSGRCVAIDSALGWRVIVESIGEPATAAPAPEWGVPSTAGVAGAAAALGVALIVGCAAVGSRRSRRRAQLREAAVALNRREHAAGGLSTGSILRLRELYSGEAADWLPPLSDRTTSPILRKMIARVGSSSGK